MVIPAPVRNSLNQDKIAMKTKQLFLPIKFLHINFNMFYISNLLLCRRKQPLITEAHKKTGQTGNQVKENLF